ncbi:DUF1499 domain-containing protein [Sedimenticola sp.]|uniref:DUF1499 domain-containing protein n=1 Tax=Sedimenticola sp. TaxID=1940285 RepID=UPI003D0BE9B8
MKTTLIILLSLVVAGIVFFFILGIISGSGTAAGLANGRLSRCPDKPNCVCSEYAADSKHYIEPISITSDVFDPLPRLKNIISKMGGAIQTEQDSYLAVTFISAVFRFVDDLEIRVDRDQRQIHIRSASRVGYSDAGVNKQRVRELIRLYGDGLSEK